MPFALRAATPEDADAIAGVLTASFRLLNFLPMLHTAEEDRRFIANVVLRDCAVTVAEDETGIVSFLARHGEEVRLLYTRPDRIGSGAGTQLIEAAKASGVAALFSFAPESWQGYREPVILLSVIAMITLNLRGVKESVKILMPIFLAFRRNRVRGGADPCRRQGC